MAYWFDLSIEGNVFVKSFERSDGGVIPHYVIAHNESYSDEEKLKLPEIVRVDIAEDVGPADFPSVLGNRGAGYLFFSEQLRDLLVQLEPGVHDFVSVDIRMFPKPLNDSDRVLATYYMWYSPPAVETIIPELSCYTKGFGLAARSESLGRLSSSENNPCVLRGSVLEGRHCWREIYRDDSSGTIKKDVRKRFSFFCSSEFYSRIRFLRLAGFEFLKKCDLR